MRRADQFSDAVRRGARSGTRRLVVHLGAAATDDLEPTSGRHDDAALVGFVVPKAVGNAVRRNEVRRRLRHLMAARLVDLPARSRVVVRALPASAGATSSELAADLDSALTGARRRAERATAGKRAGR